MKFRLKNDKLVQVFNEEGKQVGEIFSPSGSGKTTLNAIQVCGFSEAFDLWGCGVFKGFKDIQLLFDGTKMEGNSSIHHGIIEDDCMRCYRMPCQCEVKIDGTNPFAVKRENEISKRIIEKNPTK